MGTMLDRFVRKALDVGVMSQAELAREAGLHPVTVAKWRLVSASPDSAIRIARVLKRRARTMADVADRLEVVAREAKEAR